MVVDVGERVPAEEGCKRRRVVGSGGCRPELDRLVVGGGDKMMAGAREGRTAHEARVRVHAPGHRAVGEVPADDLAVTAARDERRERGGTLREAVNAVHVAAERADERLAEVLVELHGVERAHILAALLKRVELRLRRAHDTLELG